jgi:hypothetical protein
MTPNADIHSLISQLRQALRESGLAAADSPMEMLPDKGLAHDHVRLVGTGLLARVPKQSQMDLGAVDNLLYQRACFERAAASGHTPRLHGWLPPTSALPRGALPDPLQALALEIEAQASYLTDAGLAPDVLRLIDAERARLRQCCDHGERPARSLIAFDGHPGNFLIRDDGSAVLVDLEKCRYGYPGLDLAHATLYTSTTWDVATHAVLTEGEVLAFYQGWVSAAGEGAADALRWHLPLRRAMWLWSITWCAKWRVLSRRERKPGADGEDWSAERSESALVTHVRERVDHYLGLPVVQRVLDGFGSFERGLRA